MCLYKAECNMFKLSITKFKELIKEFIIIVYVKTFLQSINLYACNVVNN